MFLILVIISMYTTYIESITIERAGFTKGDSIIDVLETDCKKWKGLWKSEKCFCSEGKSFYSISTDIFGCYVGVGSNIGCTLRTFESKNEASIVTFYRKDDSESIVEIGTVANKDEVKSCKKKNLKVWSPTGWNENNFMTVKLGPQGEIKVGFASNADLKTQIEGQLFKWELSSCTKGPSEACFLFKSLGNSKFPSFYTTTISPTTHALTSSSTNSITDKTKQSSSSDTTAIVLGVTCAILVLIVLFGFIFWYVRRGKNQSGEGRNFMKWLATKQSNARRKSADYDNIYEDIGKTQLKAIRDIGTLNKRNEDVYLAPVERQSKINRGFTCDTQYTQAKHIEEDVYDTPCEEDAPELPYRDVLYDMPCEDLPNLPAEDLYETPVEEGVINCVKTSTEETYEPLDCDIDITYRDSFYNQLSESHTITAEERYSTLEETCDKTNYCKLQREEEYPNDGLYTEALHHETPPTTEPFYFQTTSDKWKK